MGQTSGLYTIVAPFVAQGSGNGQGWDFTGFPREDCRPACIVFLLSIKCGYFVREKSHLLIQRGSAAILGI